MSCVKICITGPESSGKTTLSKKIAGYYSAPLVVEEARDYLNNLDRKHNFGDLEKIAKRQQNAIDEKKEFPLVFCDTDLLTIKIWAEDKFQRQIDWVNETLEKNTPNLYVLCYPDLPWEADQLREDEKRLVIIYKKYLTEIEKSGVPYIIAKGKGDRRMLSVIKELEKHVTR